MGEGYISIVSTLNISILPNGKKVINPILLLRERNINRPIVDLLSYKTSCASLTEQGCKYDFEHRPSGGKILIPRENGKCYDPTSLNKVEVWLSYQKVLQRVVKRITGKNVEECLKEDVINLFMDFMLDNTSGVSDNELQEIVILSFIPFTSFKAHIGIKNLELNLFFFIITTLKECVLQSTVR